MEHLGRKSDDSFRSTSSYSQSYRGRSHRKQLQRKTTKTHTAEKVRNHKPKTCEISSSVFWITMGKLVILLEGVCLLSLLFLPACRHASCIHVLEMILSLCVCVCVLYVCVILNHRQHPSAMSEPLSANDRELVSSSLTIAALPLLVLTRRRSQSLTNEISDVRDKKGSFSASLNSHRSDSFDSLNFGQISSTDSRSPQGVPRIIVISPTSESSLVKHDSVCLEDSIEAMENNVFVSLNFSSEVFEAVELLS